ncbi:MAG TPA: sialidase family protein [Phycisphaerae bacterium]|nr:sialidase family protein [Phycisphaerae bacterium]
MLTKTHLFEARTQGYHTYRIPGLLATGGGVVLATCEARPGGGGDYDDNDILLRRSPDGGKTWQPHRLVVGHDRYGPGPVSNFAMIGDQSDGAVHALYCHDYARAFYVRSDDCGASFSPPVEITAVLEEFRREYPWQVCATGPGHGTQLRSGRLIVPVWLSDGTGTEFGPGKRGHRPSAVSLVYSDDHGRTWRRGEIVCRHGQGVVVNPSETAMVELADGSVLFNLRSESARSRRLVSVSPDGVAGWSEPRFDEALLEPVCMAGLIRYSGPDGGQRSCILFANPDNLENDLIPPGGHVAHDRKRLTVKLSDDECRTWAISKVIEEGPSGYCDLAVPADGAVLCLYECGLVEHLYDNRYLTLARFDLEWLTGGQDNMDQEE